MPKKRGRYSNLVKYALENIQTGQEYLISKGVIKKSESSVKPDDERENIIFTIYLPSDRYQLKAVFNVKEVNNTFSFPMNTVGITLQILGRLYNQYVNDLNALQAKYLQKKRIKERIAPQTAIDLIYILKIFMRAADEIEEFNNALVVSSNHDGRVRLSLVERLESDEDLNDTEYEKLYNLFDAMTESELSLLWCLARTISGTATPSMDGIYQMMIMKLPRVNSINKAPTKTKSKKKVNKK